MSSKRKPLSQEFVESDDDDKKPSVNKKKAKTAVKDEGDGEEDNGGGSAMSKNDDGDKYLELSNTRRVTVRVYQKKCLVDIREYYSKDDKMLPGKKGISLSKEQWQMLKDNMSIIDEAVQEKS